MRVSDAEWEVLRVVWQHPECTATEIAALVVQDTPWKPATVKTLLGRLVKKQVLGLQPALGGARYHPLVTQAEAEAAARRSFVQKVYRGRTKPLITALLRDEALTSEEIAELHRLLDDNGTSS